MLFVLIVFYFIENGESTNARAKGQLGFMANRKQKRGKLNFFCTKDFEI